MPGSQWESSFQTLDAPALNLRMPLSGAPRFCSECLWTASPHSWSLSSWSSRFLADPARPIGSRRGRRAAPAPANPQSGPAGSQGATLAPDRKIPIPTPAPFTQTSDSASESTTAPASPLVLDSEPGAKSREGDSISLPLDEMSSPHSQHSAETLLSVAAPEAENPTALTPVPEREVSVPAVPNPPAPARHRGTVDFDPDEVALEGLVVCVGEPVVEFVPSVRASTRQAPHLVFATWRSMQWVAPDFARAPGATSCQVALALGRMSVPVAFLGAVGDDLTGQQLLENLEAERVRTEGLVVSPHVRTSVSHLRLPSSFHAPPPAQLLAEAAALPQDQGVSPGLASAGEEAEDGVDEPLLASLPTMLPLLHEVSS